MVTTISLRRRVAFTLIELLVVIAIIAILAALLLGGVMVFLRKGPEVRNRNDITQMSLALDRFKAKYKIYPPSRIRLCSNRGTYNSNPSPIPGLDAESLSYIGSMWPTLTLNNVDWLASGGPGPFNQDVTLEGDQCLVFFLGGPPSASGGLLGFSTDPQRPTRAPIPNEDREKFYDFNPNRLVTLRANNPFPSYLDAHETDLDAARKKPFLYFSSNKRADGYVGGNALFSVSPYAKTSGGFHNSTTFQIISAGPDGMFGPGGTWPPVANATGNDDVSNFHGARLGSP